MEDDNLSSASFVSSISTTSSVHQPRPPGGPKPTSQGFSRSSDTGGKVVRSPYLVSSTPYPNNKKQKLNYGSKESLRSSHNKISHSGGVPVVWGSPPSCVPHPSVSTFLQSLMKTQSFSATVSPVGGSNRRRSNSSTTKPRPRIVQSTSGPSVSGQMDAIELRDETVKMRKEMNVLRKERDIAKAQQVRLSKEILKKDKQINDLMSAGHVSTRDATRSLVKNMDRKNVPNQSGGSSSKGGLISSLRQQVHSLERALREKEGQVMDLKNSVKATQIKEMEVQTESYYREICRLKELLRMENNGTEDMISSVSTREASIKVKALNQATIKMARKIESLEEENTTLKEKNELFQSGSFYHPSAMSPNPKEVGVRGSIADQYEDHNRTQMLSAIVSLEMLKKGVAAAREEKDQAQGLHERRIGELRGQISDLSNTISLRENQLAVSQDSEAKLKSVIKRLKEDRTHYREAAEHTQNELCSVQELIKSEELSKEELMEELKTLQEEHQKEMTAIQHSRKFSKRQSQVFSPSKEKRDNAATTIQQNWKRRQATVKQEKHQRETEEVMVNIQSAFRGHLARKNILMVHEQQYTPSHQKHSNGSMSEDEIDSESTASSEAIELVQSTMKGYLTRQMTLQDLSSLSKDGSSEEVETKINLNRSSSLLRYSPPLQIHTDSQIPLQSFRKKNMNQESPWKLDNSLKIDNRQTISSLHYFSSTDTESNGPNPDQHLLMDELS